MRPLYRRFLSTISAHRGIARSVEGQTFRWRYPFSQFDADYEAPVYAAFRQHVQPGMTVFDIGANFGLFTLAAAAAVGNAGKVYAFEPSSATAAVLTDHLRLNGLASRVKVVPLAVNDISGAVEFWEQGTSPLASLSRRAAWRSTVQSGRAETDQRVVQAVSIDDFCRDHGVYPDVIKLDAEGAEARILRGARRLLGRRACVIFLEAHPWVLDELGDTHEALLRELASLGWTYDLLYRRGEEDDPNATIHYLCAWPEQLGRPEPPAYEP